MRRALEDASTQFVRDDALLAVIIVTDEVDCSTTNDRVDWLQTEGYPFWTTAERPTSAVCWRAGVSCVGSPDGYDDCVPVDKGFDGLDVAPGEPSVLDPVQIYIDSVSALAHEKQMRGGRGQILLALIAGVPLDYPQTQTMLFANSALQEFNVEYGIGPGCNVGTETVDDPPGIPPVRMRQLVEAFAAGENSIFSICSEDYSIALERIASAIGEINERACLAGCSVDTHANKIGVQPSCRLTEDFTDESGRIDSPVPQCVQTLDGWAFPDAAVDTCYRVLNDIEGITPSTVDDLSSQCRTLGWDAELVVERRQGIAVPAGTAVKVECDLLGPTGVACDDL
jgi:hypothetical protein